MNNFLYSSTMLYILVALLVLTFFLPDIIGPVPAVIIGGLVICFALFVYNKWSSIPGENQDEPPEEGE